MKRSLALLAYSALTFASQPLVPLLLRVRLWRGKEDPARIAERLGLASRQRPVGHVVWMHGASIGECLSLLPCMEALIARGYHVVVTSGSLGSARVLAERLPSGSTHQFLPLDLYRFAARFLDHWRPDMVLFAESEIWPNVFRAIRARRLALVLVNARLSSHSFARWSKAHKAAANIFGTIDLCLAQTQGDANRFADLGAPNVRVAGNLKFDAKPPPADPGLVAEVAGQIAARPVWAAVSTHRGEDELVADAHLALSTTLGGLLTIIAPRHPQRADEIVAMMERRQLKVARRSRRDAIDPDTDIYMVDTLGEAGLIYRVCRLAFLGRSLTVRGGGQNPLEAAKLGCTILHGPRVGNFGEVYDALDDGGGAYIVQNGRVLTETIAHLLSDAQALRSAGRHAAHIAERHGGATARVMQAIEPYLTSAR